MVEVTLGEKRYRRIRSVWYDDAYLKASHVVAAQLDELYPSATFTPPRSVRVDTPNSVRRMPAQGNWGRDWVGLTDKDFQNGVAGTHWRGRPGLGGALALELRHAAGREFSPWAVYRRADVYFALQERFRTGNKVASAKFSLELSPTEALSGLYCERSDEPMGDEWDWWRLLDALADGARQKALMNIMQLHKLQWIIEPAHGQTLQPRVYVSAGGALVWQPHGCAFEPIDWDMLLTRLQDWPADQWVNLYLGRVRTKEEAISASASLASTLATEFAALIELYDACTDGASRTQAQGVG